MKRIVDPNLDQRDPLYLMKSSYFPKGYQLGRTVAREMAESHRATMRTLIAGLRIRIEDDPLKAHRCPYCGEAGFMPHACAKEEVAK